MLMLAHALADAWGGMTPQQILDTMTALEIQTAAAWYEMRHRQQMQHDNQRTAAARAANTKRQF